MVARGVAELKAWRDARRHPRDKPPDKRSQQQRDRDRILYSSAFRRLGAVTQVVWAKEEGHLFHNRLTHSLKVAQVGRRLAEYLIADARTPRLKSAIRELGGLDADAVEAAGLAHDLGHPPFGHIAEEELNNAVQGCAVPDGFEGNAQSFRIITKLAAIDPNIVGMNLTRATLNAILKYPVTSTSGSAKYGAYITEQEDFDWARMDLDLPQGTPTLEAEVMDWADDIAYAVHDLEDFYRAGLIPLHALGRTEDLEPVFERVRGKWAARHGGVPTADELREVAAAGLRSAELYDLIKPFAGSRTERARLRSYTSRRVSQLISATSFTLGGLSIGRTARIEVEVLKQLTRHFVVENGALATQQVGQRRVIRDLYKEYHGALTSGHAELFPPRTRDEVKSALETPSHLTQARVVCDVIAGMTEAQAVAVHQRMAGIEFGPLLDPAVM